MELGLSLGDAGAGAAASKPFGFIEKSSHEIHHHQLTSKGVLGFCMGLSIAPINVGDHQGTQDHEDDDDDVDDDNDDDDADDQEEQIQQQQHTTTPATSASNAEVKKPNFMDSGHNYSASVDPPVQLDLLPNTPVPRNFPFPWPSSDNGSSDAGSSGQMARGFDVNKFPLVEEPEDGAALSSSPNNSAASSFQMDFCIYSRGGDKKDLSNEAEVERGSSRFSDEDENGCTRKKLRLSKEQSAFLEESFKEHNTLNPKQKLALAKQLNLRPRQVEVWFQNRRARTKLKQTEVDCEYLKRCCETLTEENRRLHKELQELRALKTSNPYYMQLPATTLTMCPSCERVATTNTTPPTGANTTTTTTTTTPSPTISITDPTSKATGFPLTRPRFYPFSHNQTHSHQPTSSREK